MHDELPVRPGRGDAREQLEVHALVDDAEKAEARPANRGLVGRIAAAAGAPRAKCATSTLLGNAWMFACMLPLGFVQDLAAGEHHVGALQQLRFGRVQPGGRAGERRQLVHAVVDDGGGSR